MVVCSPRRSDWSLPPPLPPIVTFSFASSFLRLSKTGNHSSQLRMRLSSEEGGNKFHAQHVRQNKDGVIPNAAHCNKLSSTARCSNIPDYVLCITANTKLNLIWHTAPKLHTTFDFSSYATSPTFTALWLDPRYGKLSQKGKMWSVCSQDVAEFVC